jgi:hypothetical protein
MAVTQPAAQSSRPSPYDALAPGIKLAAQLSPEPEAEDLAWVAQMGIVRAGCQVGRLLG